jgi:hypothetical protein
VRDIAFEAFPFLKEPKPKIQRSTKTLAGRSNVLFSRPAMREQEHDEQDELANTRHARLPVQPGRLQQGLDGSLIP